MKIKPQIISLRENPSYLEDAIKYIQAAWPDVYPKMYDDCLRHSINAENDFPQWYLLEFKGELMGCAGLILNDSISRIDLYPWVATLHISKEHRGKRYSKLLIDKAKADCKAFDFKKLYLCTDHIGLYEKFDFSFIGHGYHPWEEKIRIYECSI